MFEFQILDPKKNKRSQVKATLSPLGGLNWQKFPKFSLRRYPETKERVEAAFAAGTKMPKSPIFEKLKKIMLAMQYNGTRRWFAAHPDKIAVVWNGLNGSRRVFADGAKDAGARCLFYELAPLPGRVTVDPGGVNFFNSLPRRIAPYVNWAKSTGISADHWVRFRDEIVQRRPLQALRDLDHAPSLSKPFVFVPLQVPGDSQLRLFGGDFATLNSFVQSLTEAASQLPPGWHIRVKEHPSAPGSAAFIRSLPEGTRIFIDNETDTFEQVAASRLVVTVNSSVGIEAMFFQKPVIACGYAFWAIPGIAGSAMSSDALKNMLAVADEHTFCTEARAAFLSFLAEEYWIRLPDEREPEMYEVEVAKIRKRLVGDQPPDFWQF